MATRKLGMGPPYPGQSNDGPPLCSACENYRDEEYDDSWNGACTRAHPLNMRSLVDGGVMTRRLSCEQQRTGGDSNDGWGHCGESALFFVEITVANYNPARDIIQEFRDAYQTATLPTASRDIRDEDRPANRTAVGSQASFSGTEFGRTNSSTGISAAWERAFGGQNLQRTVPVPLPDEIRGLETRDVGQTTIRTNIDRDIVAMAYYPHMDLMTESFRRAVNPRYAVPREDLEPAASPYPIPEPAPQGPITDAPPTDAPPTIG